MGVKQTVLEAGWTVIGLALMVGLVLIGSLFIEGSVVVSAKLLPWLMWAFWIVLAIDVAIFLPLALIRPTQGFAGMALIYTSYLFGLTLWAWSLLLTYDWWGWVGVVVGLVFAGIGVVPVAMLAALVHGAWLVLGEALFMLVVAYGIRALGTYVTMLAQERALAQATEESEGRLIDVHLDDWHQGHD